MTTVTAIRPDVYDLAMRVALSADDDWGRKLAAARTLADSPEWRHQNLARHIREAHALHLVGLLRPVDPVHRDRADLRDMWREAAMETPADVMRAHSDRWPEIMLYADIGATILLAVTGWL